MSGDDGLKASQEYDSLREELNQSKKYVFERPLVIVGVGVALITTVSGQYGPPLAAVMTGLLLFNFVFTVNRLMSSARIVAYIQVVLEGDAKWRGWETSLREYRIWLNDNPEAKKRIVERELNQKAVPDALMYFPMIYNIHIALVFLCLVAAVLLTLRQASGINIVATVLIVPLVILFFRYCMRWKPSTMRSLIERNIVIWEHALGLRKANE
jgi:hypothetical protein